MSRIGRMPVSIAKGVEVKQSNGTLVVKGPKGTLDLHVHPEKTVGERQHSAAERPRDHS